MNKLIQRYIDAGKKVKAAIKHKQEAEENANAAKLPNKLRPAEANDVIEGAVIWYPEWKTKESDPDGDSRGWNIVDEVLFPSDEWKAYCAHDGCRYGLDGAYVEL